MGMTSSAAGSFLSFSPPSWLYSCVNNREIEERRCSRWCTVVAAPIIEFGSSSLLGKKSTMIFLFSVIGWAIVDEWDFRCVHLIWAIRSIQFNGPNCVCPFQWNAEFHAIFFFLKAFYGVMCPSSFSPTTQLDPGCPIPGLPTTPYGSLWTQHDDEWFLWVKTYMFLQLRRDSVSVSRTYCYIASRNINSHLFLFHTLF